MFEVGDDDCWAPAYFANTVHSLREKSVFFAVDNYVQGHMNIPRMCGKYCDMLKTFSVV